MTGPDNKAGYGNGFGQVWGYDTRSETLCLVYQSPEPERARLPGQHHRRAGAAPWCSARTTTSDNYLRGLSRGGQLWDIALNRLQSGARR